MFKSEKDLLDLLLFTINQKAIEANKNKKDVIDQSSGDAEFWRGQYMAFSEVYSLLTNIKNTL